MGAGSYRSPQALGLPSAAPPPQPVVQRHRRHPEGRVLQHTHRHLIGAVFSYRRHEPGPRPPPRPGRQAPPTRESRRRAPPAGAGAQPCACRTCRRWPPRRPRLQRVDVTSSCECLSLHAAPIGEERVLLARRPARPRLVGVEGIVRPDILDDAPQVLLQLGNRRPAPVPVAVGTEWILSPGFTRRCRESSDDASRPCTPRCRTHGRSPARRRRGTASSHRRPAGAR